MTTPKTKHPKTPATLSKPGAALWRSIVRDYPVDHFNTSNRILLQQMIEQWDFAQQCDKAIADHGMILGGKLNPAVTARGVALGHFRAIAVKLRLPIASTMRAEKAAARPDSKHALPNPWDEQ